MANKQATVYVVDLGATMADCHSGRIESDVCISSIFRWSARVLSFGMRLIQQSRLLRQLSGIPEIHLPFLTLSSCPDTY